MNGEPPAGDHPNDTGWYVYGVVAAAAGEVLDGAPNGVDPTRDVVVVDDDQLGAVASEVSLDEFGEGALEANLHDVEWLVEKARAHDAVLEAAVGRVAIVPFRFGTIYRSREQMLAMLAERRAALLATLERVRGRVELGVKVYLDRARFEESRAAGHDESPTASGRAYMLAKSRERELAQAAAAFGSDCARLTHERLARAADDARANPLQSPDLAQGPGEMLLNGAYLVRADQQEAFRSTVDELESAYADQGVVYALTGPWPPYNFVAASADER